MSAIQATVFNKAQLELIDMMSFVRSPEMLSQLKQIISDYFAREMLSQLKQIISDYFARQAEEEIDRLWTEGTLDNAKVEGFRHLHERTPYTDGK